MTALKVTPEALAESIMNAQLARQHEFGSAIAEVDSAFTKMGRYGGDAWYADRNRIGKDELRKRAEDHPRGMGFVMMTAFQAATLGCLFSPVLPARWAGMWQIDKKPEHEVGIRTSRRDVYSSVGFNPR